MKTPNAPEPSALLAEIMRSLRPGPGGTYRLEAHELEGPQKQALAREDGAALYAIVGDLVSFAGFLRQGGSEAAAKAVIEMARPVAKKLEEVAQRDARRNLRAEEASRKLSPNRSGRHESNPASRVLEPGGRGLSLRRK